MAAAWWRRALGAGAAVAVAVVAPRAPADGACELDRADRARTPATACMSCHDGAAGPGVPFRMRAANRPGFDHPVDVDYALARARDPRLAPGATLPPSVILVDGKVSCTTCHDGASTLPGRIAGPQRALCTSCHEM